MLFVALINLIVPFSIFTGDVLSGTTASGIHHTGVLEGWFGVHWWNGRFVILLVTTLAIFAPLASLKRIGDVFFLGLENSFNIWSFQNIFIVSS